MATVHVRRLDDDVVRQLKRRAVENNRSLESEARHILEQAAEDGMTEKMQGIRGLGQASAQGDRRPSSNPRAYLDQRRPR